MDNYIGCSGYYYPQWKGKLYPKDLASRSWLAYYSSVFNTVELNGTFYRRPQVSALKQNNLATPVDFAFSVKMSRYITHVQRLKDKQTTNDFQSLILDGLEHKLRHFLFQMPPNFHYSEENLGKIISGIPHNPQNVVEFRHISWWNNRVKDALSSANITFCNIDYPGLDSWFISSSDRFYLRLHGNPKLFVTSYTRTRLKDFYNAFPESGITRSVYFNNTVTEAGFRNARQLMKIAMASSLVPIM